MPPPPPPPLLLYHRHRCRRRGRSHFPPAPPPMRFLAEPWLLPIPNPQKAPTRCLVAYAERGERGGGGERGREKMGYETARSRYAGFDALCAGTAQKHKHRRGISRRCLSVGSGRKKGPGLFAGGPSEEMRDDGFTVRNETNAGTTWALVSAPYKLEERRELNCRQNPERVVFT